MELSYKLEKFEGPLDLLLHLIEKNKVNIYDIPIAEITDQYMEYVRQMDEENLDVVSEFLVMAATLLDIKARMLLPKEVNEEGEEEDPRAELVQQLLEYKMYKYILKKTKKYGFKHYEVSNFALNNHESIHNKTYWKNEEYYGFGLSSHGFINGVRYENTRNFNKYLNGDYRLNELLVSTEEDMENEVMLGLRLMNGISISHFKEKFGYSIDKIFKIKEAIKKGYLIKENDYIKIPENKIYVMNEIINFIME